METSNLSEHLTPGCQVTMNLLDSIRPDIWGKSASSHHSGKGAGFGIGILRQDQDKDNSR